MNASTARFGTSQRLYQSGIDPKNVATIFITHLHNDHIVADKVTMTPPPSLDNLQNLNSEGQKFP